MGWAEKKIEEYKKGKKATWIEKIMLEHANPVHFVLCIIGAIIAIYGLWTHDWLLIIAGFLFGLIGHIYCHMQK